MLTVYGDLMPLRLLEEIRFWKRQEKEHASVIRELAPNLEPQYAQTLKEWEPVLAQTEFAARHWTEAALRSPSVIPPYIHMQVEGLLNASAGQSRQFNHYLLFLVKNSAAIHENPAARTVIHHIIRESENFSGVLHAFTAGHQSPGQAAQGGPALQQVRLHEHVEQPPSSGLTATGEGQWSAAPRPDSTPVPIGGHKLPPLPYPYDALEPHIDAETMRLHHDKHHQTYVDGLNKAEKMMAEARQTGDFALIKHWEREAAFHGAGHYLHTLFWNIMAPRAGGKAEGPIAAQIAKDFGSFDRFKKHFSEAAEKVEGGGWALLVWSPRSHRLEILQAEKHQNLSQWDVIPLLVLDVWEHAYYLRYKNERAKYIEAWWNTVNWKHVNERFAAARQLQWTPY